MKWSELAPFFEGALAPARWPPFPRTECFQIGPRRQGSASPLRALDRSGPIRRDGCLRGKEGNRSTSDFVCHLIVFDKHSATPQPACMVFLSGLSRASRGLPWQEFM